MKIKIAMYALALLAIMVAPVSAVQLFGTATHAEHLGFLGEPISENLIEFVNEDQECTAELHGTITACTYHGFVDLHTFRYTPDLRGSARSVQYSN